jgi:Fe2+ or Zn2+ uptake regulation protein
MVEHLRRGLLHQLRARGIRLTPQRAVLVEILDGHDEFLDAATLCALARRRGVRVDRATVYRTLALLRTNQLMGPEPDAAGRQPAAFSAPPLRSEEVRLVCEQCRKQQPVSAETPALIKKVLQRCTGFLGKAVNLQASGECRLCAARSRIKQRSGRSVD